MKLILKKPCKNPITAIKRSFTFAGQSAGATYELVELVDLFPTIVEAAGLDPLDLCPPQNHNIALCTEGMSLMPLIRADDGVKWKDAAFSWHPREGETIMG